MTSVLPPTSDVSGPDREVAKVPKGDIRPGPIVMHYQPFRGCETLW